MVSINELLSILNELSQTSNPDNFPLKENGASVDLNSISTLKDLKVIWDNAVDTQICSSHWRFLQLSLECLVRLKNSLAREKRDENRLVSVAHQRSVRTLLAQVVDLGLIPSLLPFLRPPGTTLKPTSEISDIQKYDRLCLITLVLVELCQDNTFHGIVLPQFLLPLLCALCQLALTPLKKSADYYPRLSTEREVFQQHLTDITERLYQPMIIKELMVIQGNKESPLWLKRSVGKILTGRLLRGGGVLATLQAVRDAANCAAPTTTAHLEAVARVIVGSKQHDCICPQILDLLDSNDVELSRMGVLCVKTLYTQDKSACENYILQPLAKPLTQSTSTEEDISQCLNRLHKCFAVPASDLWCLSYDLLQPYIQVLFQLHCKIYQSACFLKQTVEDLVWRFLVKCDSTSISDVFKCLLYKEKIPGVGVIGDFEFCFGDHGGVRFTSMDPEADRSLEHFGDCLMVLLENRDKDGHLGNKLFVTLLKFSTEIKDTDTIDGIEKQLLNMKLLSVLAESPTVQKSLSENPEPVVKFLRSMIDEFLSDTKKDVEVISLVLVVLNVILNDCIFSKKCCWNMFSQLEQPLLLLKGKATDAALRSLAEEAYEAIVTRGVMKPNALSSKSVNKDCIKPESSCEEALREACDPLLPVRGHAIVQLGKLVASKDRQARAKKDQILCIFQENLKQEDSYLYLSAIEALAVAAAEYPDSAIMILTEQYKQHSLPSETRLKVGEALVRVIRLLGDLVPAYKAELFNAFFQGTRDDDYLVRASSLSNLGELCHSLGFRVAPLIAEVLECANSIVQYDPSVVVRRSAVLLITMLTKGLQSDMFTVLENALLNIYRTLKLLHTTDKDDVIRLHAQLALEELKSGTMAFLFPTPKLEKPVFILDSS